MADKQFRMFDFKGGFEGQEVYRDAYRGTYRDHKLSYGATANYVTQHYLERNYCEFGVSTKRKMEGEMASARWRPDVYNYQTISVDECVNNLANDGVGWWPGGRMYWNKENVVAGHGSDLWEDDTYDRNVTFHYMRESGGEPENRDYYYIRYYNGLGFTRGSYTKARSCIHGEGHDDYPGIDENPFFAIWRDGDTSRDKYGNPRDTARAHPYHEFGYMQGGSWNQIIMDFHASMWNKNHGVGNLWWPQEYPYQENQYSLNEQDTAHNYFDCQTWCYTFLGAINPQTISNKVQGECESYESGERYYVERHQKDRDAEWFYHSLVGAYNAEIGSTGWGTFQFNFSPYSYATFYMEVRYAFEDMHQYTKDNGTSGFDAIGQTATTNNKDVNGNTLYKEYNWPDFQADATGHEPPPGEARWRAWSRTIDGKWGGAMSNWGEANMITYWTDQIDPAVVPTQPDGKKYVWFACRAMQSMWDPLDDGWWLNPGDPTYENKVGPFDPTVFRQICIPVQTDQEGDGILPLHLKD